MVETSGEIHKKLNKFYRVNPSENGYKPTEKTTANLIRF